MYKITFLLVVSLLIISCGDDEDGLSPALQLEFDGQIIDDYLLDNNIDAQEDPSGLRYRITEPGAGSTPDASSNVVVEYEGRFLSSGVVFDGSETGVEFPLSNLITAWQIGIPLIAEGGSITLYVPSGLAYGSRGNSSIPPNSILIFDIKLLEVN